MGTYLRLLRLPHVAPLLAANLLSRLPIGITGLALVLFLRAQTGSFAVAGAVSGALTLGLGVCSPFVGKLVDRRGAQVLGPLSLLHAAGLVALLVLGRAEASTGGLVACGFLTGAVLPPTGSLLRAGWPALVAPAPELLPTAFAVEAVLIEAIFVTGPLIVGLLLLVADAGAALVVAAVAVIAGTWSFVALLPPAAAPARVAAATAVPRLGALAVPGIRTIVLVMVPVGISFGLVEVALPALARADGRPELAGLLLALWAAASAAGGIAWGARVRGISAGRAHVALACLLPVGFAPVLLAPSAGLAALLVLPAGLAIAPLIATRNELTGRVAPPGAAIEAFTWPTTALLAGIAIGTPLAGALADGPGWRAAVLSAIGAAALGALLTLARRASLEPATVR